MYAVTRSRENASRESLGRVVQHAAPLQFLEEVIAHYEDTELPGSPARSRPATPLARNSYAQPYSYQMRLTRRDALRALGRHGRRARLPGRVAYGAAYERHRLIRVEQDIPVSGLAAGARWSPRRPHHRHPPQRHGRGRRRHARGDAACTRRSPI